MQLEYTPRDRAAFEQVNWLASGAIDGHPADVPRYVGGDFNAVERQHLDESRRRNGEAVRFWQPSPGISGAKIQCSAIVRGPRQTILINKPLPLDGSYIVAHHYVWKVRQHG
jgi:hypothetical protein